MTTLTSLRCDQCGKQNEPTPSWARDSMGGWSTIPAGLWLSAHGGGCTMQCTVAQHFCTAECLRIWVLASVDNLANPSLDPAGRDE
jgi:hypothetical protein